MPLKTLAIARPLRLKFPRRIRRHEQTRWPFQASVLRRKIQTCERQPAGIFQEEK
jgi:hypothetical protein